MAVVKIIRTGHSQPNFRLPQVPEPEEKEVSDFDILTATEGF